MAITYPELRRIQRICRENTGIYSLGDTFIEDVSAYVSEKKQMIAKNNDKGNPFSEEMKEKVQNELKNSLKVIDDIFKLREKKIIYRAILSARKEKPIYDTTNMLEQEKKLFNTVIEYLKDHRDHISSCVMSSEKVKKEKDVSFKTKMVRFLESVPEFVWNNEKYGPFSNEDIANLPEELADLLVQREKSVEVMENENT